MTRERRYYHTINIADMPEMVELARQVQQSKQPARLEINGEEAGTLIPPKIAKGSRRRFRPLAADDPLWNIVGMHDAQDGPTDVSENKHKYLAEAYTPKNG